MGLFDMFGKKKKEEKKETNSIEYNVNEIIDSSYDERKKRYEEMNKERERKVQENYQKIMERAKQEMEIKEKERLLARKERELEKAKQEMIRKTSEEFEQFEKDAQQIKNEMQDKIDKTTQEQERIVTDISERIQDLDNLPGATRARNVAVEEYKKLLNMSETNKNKKEFEKYDKISELLLSSEWRLDIWKKDNKDQVLKYRELTESDRKSFFVPFLIEKKSYGLADVNDKKNLDQMRKNSNMSSKEQYTRGLVLLQEFQLIDITDTDTFSKTFKEFSTMTREEIKAQADLEVMMEDTPKKDEDDGKKNYL